MNICGQSGKTIFTTMGEAHKAVAALRNKHAACGCMSTSAETAAGSIPRSATGRS